MRAAMLVMILTKSLTRSSLVSSGNTPQVLNSLIILLSPIIEGKARFVNHQTNKDQCRMHHRISGVYSRVDPCGQPDGAWGVCNEAGPTPPPRLTARVNPTIYGAMLRIVRAAADGWSPASPPSGLPARLLPPYHHSPHYPRVSLSFPQSTTQRRAHWPGPVRHRRAKPGENCSQKLHQSLS